MPEPVFTASTERFYSRLPEHYRTADARLDWPFKRYLSCILDEYDAVSTLIDRVDWVLPGDGGDPDDTSELVDPARADASWLPWLGQKVGLDVDRATTSTSYRDTYGTLALAYPTVDDLAAAADTWAELGELTTNAGGEDLTVDELRLLIADPEVFWRAGSKGSIRAALAPYLTDTKRVAIITHVDDDPFQFTVRTYAAETPDPYVLAGALARSEAADIAGAGYTVETIAGATYAELAIEFPTVDDMIDTGLTYAELSVYVPTY